MHHAPAKPVGVEPLCLPMRTNTPHVSGCAPMTANRIVRPCYCPASKRCWRGEPKTRGTPCLSRANELFVVRQYPVTKWRYGSGTTDSRYPRDVRFHRTTTESCAALSYATGQERPKCSAANLMRLDRMKDHPDRPAFVRPSLKRSVDSFFDEA